MGISEYLREPRRRENAPLSSTPRQNAERSDRGINREGEEEQRQPTEGVIVFAVSYVWQANRSATSGSTPSSI